MPTEVTAEYRLLNPPEWLKRAPSVIAYLNECLASDYQWNAQVISHCLKLEKSGDVHYLYSALLSSALKPPHGACRALYNTRHSLVAYAEFGSKAAGQRYATIKSDFTVVMGQHNHAETAERGISITSSWGKSHAGVNGIAIVGAHCGCARVGKGGTILFVTGRNHIEFTTKSGAIKPNVWYGLNGGKPEVWPNGVQPKSKKILGPRRKGKTKASRTRTASTELHLIYDPIKGKAIADGGLEKAFDRATKTKGPTAISTENLLQYARLKRKQGVLTKLTISYETEGGEAKESEVNSDGRYVGGYPDTYVERINDELM